MRTESSFGRHVAATVMIAATVVLAGTGCSVLIIPVPPPSSQSATATPTAPAPTVPAATPLATSTGVPPTGETPDPSGTGGTVAYDPTDPTTWVITFTGVGGAQLGDSVSAGRQALSGLTEEPYVGCNAHLYKPTANSPAQVPVYGINGGVADTEADQRIIVVYVGGTGGSNVVSSAATPEGIVVGSTKQQLLATYPDVVPHDTKYDGFVTYEQTDGADHYRSFQVNPAGFIQDIWVSAGTWDVPTFCD